MILLEAIVDGFGCLVKQRFKFGEGLTVIAGPNQEVSQEEINLALRHMRTRWQGTYGLVELG